MLCNKAPERIPQTSSLAFASCPVVLLQAHALAAQMAKDAVKTVERALDEGRILSPGSCSHKAKSPRVCKRAPEPAHHTAACIRVSYLVMCGFVLTVGSCHTDDGAEVDEEGPTSEQLSDIVASASSVLSAHSGKVRICWPSPQQLDFKSERLALCRSSFLVMSSHVGMCQKDVPYLQHSMCWGCECDETCTGLTP